MVSLKRTLQSDLAAVIDGFGQINQGDNGLNLHTPVRSSEVLLSIGKITKICHQNIPVKKNPSSQVVTYVSGIPLKLAHACQRPVDEVAAVLLALLVDSTLQVSWADVRKTDTGCLEFVMAEDGIQTWQHHLHHLELAPVSVAVPSIDVSSLWEFQSGYEFCCRWSAICPRVDDPLPYFYKNPQQPFMVSIPALGSLVDSLLDICDVWHEAGTTPRQLLHRAHRLVLALGQCARRIALTSPEVQGVSPWVKTTQIVLKHLLDKSWGYSLVERF